MGKKILLTKIETREQDPRVSGDLVDCLTLSVLGSCLRKEGLHADLYVHELGQSSEDLLRVIDYKKPDIVGISVKIFNARESVKAGELINKKFPSIKIIFGGLQFDKFFANFFLKKYPFAKYVVVGQGEKTLPEFVYKLFNKKSLENTAGIVYKEKGKVYTNKLRAPLTKEELDSLPLPVTDLIEDIDFEKRKEKTVQIRTSTGCNAFCSFCYNQEGKWVGMDPERVKDYFKLYLDKGFSNFLIVDNNFIGPDQKRAEKIADIILNLRKEYKKEIKFQFDGRTDSFGTIREGFNHGLLQKLVDAGLYDIFVGFESGNEYDLKLMKKAIFKGQNVLDQHLFFLENVKKYEGKLTITPGFIMLNEDSDLTRVKQNIDFIHNNLEYQLSPNIYRYLLSFYPGSTLTKKKIRPVQNYPDFESITEKIFYGTLEPDYKRTEIAKYANLLKKVKERLYNSGRVISYLERERRFSSHEKEKIHNTNYKFFMKYVESIERGLGKKQINSIIEEHNDYFLNFLRGHASDIENLTNRENDSASKEILGLLKKE